MIVIQQINPPPTKKSHKIVSSPQTLIKKSVEEINGFDPESGQGREAQIGRFPWTEHMYHFLTKSFGPVRFT